MEYDLEYYTAKKWVCSKHGENDVLCEKSDCSEYEDHCSDHSGSYGLGLSVEKARKKIEKKHKELLHKLTRQYEKYEKKYKKLCFLIGKNEESNTKVVTRVSGGLDYSMTLNEMKQYIKNRFLEIKKRGLIISKAQFKKIKSNYYLKSEHCFSRDLTRIWGIEHVKFMINNDKELRNIIDVPGYVIVVNNPKKPISVELELFPLVYGISQISPIVSKLKNADIYFEYIDGKDATKKMKKECGQEHKQLKKLFFTDFGADELAGRGNILRKDGKLYIVDTERRSFGRKSEFGRIFCCYLHDRFAYNNALNKSKIQVEIDFKIK